MSLGTNPLHHSRYLRSNAYDPQWVFENLMGPHPLWLLESLCEVMPVERGMRILDLGCGTALTSIFLAREFGAQVWATDLWIEPSANQARIEKAGVAACVIPIYGEAHALPFTKGFFDLVVSIDAYHYFGTDDLYLGYIAEFLRPGGRIGVVAPALLTELGARVPESLVPYWEWEFCSFHSPSWWRAHWEKTGKVVVDVAELVEDGWRDWLRFDEATEQHAVGWRKSGAATSAAMVRADGGANLGFSRLTATKR
jgi:cyclopropane fatty-acyl-phospholipid synthase-like methyltransferase